MGHHPIPGIPLIILDPIMPYGIIYVAICTINGKLYVGQTVRPLGVRWQAHVAKRGTLPGFSMAIKKYGAEAFQLCVLDTADSEIELNHKEQLWIRRLNTITPGGYNLNEGGDMIRPVGGPTPETRAKMSAAKLGVPRTQPTRDKISATLTGTTQPPDVVAKRTRVIRDLWATNGDEISRKISVANTGKVRSDAVRARMSEDRKGIPMKECDKEKRRGRTASPETKEKMRQAQLGKTMSPEAVEKSSLSRTGQKRSEESKEKMRQAHRLRKLSGS